MFLRHLYNPFSLCFLLENVLYREQCESTPVSLHWGICIQYPLNFKVEIEFKVFTQCAYKINSLKLGSITVFVGRL